MVCVFTDEVLWRKIIPLLSHKITPHFQLLPMSIVLSKIDENCCKQTVASLP